MNEETLISQVPVASDGRFSRVNRLLEEYAALAIDAQTGNAKDADKEGKVLDELHGLLHPIVRKYVVTFWWADPDDVEQEFWLLFIRHLHRRRMDRQPAVKIGATNYIRSWVKYAAGCRGFPPLDQLNCAIHDYLSKPSEEREKHETRLLLALERCCEELLPRRGAAKPALIGTVQVAAQFLLNRFMEERLWQGCIKPTYAHGAEDIQPGHKDDDAGLQPVSQLPHYVADWDAFRKEAYRPLFGVDPPRPSAPNPPASISSDSLIPHKYRDTVKKLIGKQLGELRPAKPEQTFGRLSCLLFLGYYETQSTFCDDFDIKDPYAVKCKGFWLEHVVEYLCSIRADSEEAPQEAILRLYKNHKYYGQFLDCLHDYCFIACTDSARIYLRDNLDIACVALRTLWCHCFCKEENVNPVDGVRFEVTAEKPPELDAFKQQDPPPDGVIVQMR